MGVADGSSEEELETLDIAGEYEHDESKRAEDESNGKDVKNKGKKKGMKRTKSSYDGSKRGVCYLSRIPPGMDPASLRHMLSQYGEIERIYLAPTDPAAAQVSRKRPGSCKGNAFSEGYSCQQNTQQDGFLFVLVFFLTNNNLFLVIKICRWVEFVKKGVAKRIANMLNGEQMGGRRRSPFFYDIWNIRYLSKFKWDDLTEEIAFKSATREQKLALEISAAKRERNYTLSKFAQARALNSIQERLKKKQRTEDSESSGKAKVDQQETKIFRRFPQNKPVNNSNQKTGILSEDILARVFGNSSS